MMNKAALLSILLFTAILFLGSIAASVIMILNPALVSLEVSILIIGYDLIDSFREYLSKASASFDKGFTDPKARSHFLFTAAHAGCYLAARSLVPAHARAIATAISTLRLGVKESVDSLHNALQNELQKGIL